MANVVGNLAAPQTGAYDPNYLAQLQQAQRQAAYAKALQSQAQEPMEIDKRGAASWTQALSKALSGYLGAKAQGDSDANMLAIQQKQQAAKDAQANLMFGIQPPDQAPQAQDTQPPQQSDSQAPSQGIPMQSLQDQIGQQNGGASSASLAAALQAPGAQQQPQDVAQPAPQQAAPNMPQPTGAPPAALAQALSPQQKSPYVLSGMTPEQSLALYKRDPETYNKMLVEQQNVSPELKSWRATGGSDDEFNKLVHGKLSAEGTKNAAPGDLITNYVTGDKTFVPKTFTTDLGGNQIYGTIDPITGKPVVASNIGRTQTPDQASKTGMGLNEDAARLIAQRFLAGDKSALTGIRNPTDVAKVQNMIASVGKEQNKSATDINNAMQNYGSQTKAIAEWNNPNGKGNQQLQSFNTVYNHLDDLEQASNALDSGDIKILTRIGQNYGLNVGGMPAKAAYDAILNAAGPEISRANIGAPGGQEERITTGHTLSSDMVNTDRLAAINAYKNTIADRAYSAQKSYEKGTGQNDYFDRVPAKVIPYLNQRAQAESALRQQQNSPAPQSQDAKDAADWISKNPNDPRVPSIKAHYGI